MLLLVGCQSIPENLRLFPRQTEVQKLPQTQPTPEPTAGAASANPAPASNTALASKAVLSESKPALPVDKPPAQTFWQQVVEARQFSDCSYDPNIENWAQRLTASPPSFNASVIRMQPYLEYVWRRTQELGMPSEIAFLPLVESDYRQVYGSYGSPGGWWQLMPAVGKMYGLSVSRQNDERVDPVKATDVALKLNQANAVRFNHDWLLTIFAYNVGGQRIANALKANDLEPGRIEHVSQLQLPKTTEDHLHRMIAWGCVFANPQKYRVSLPADLAPDEQFQVIRITQSTPMKAMETALGRFAEHWGRQHPLIEKRGEVRYGQNVLAPLSVNQQIAALGDLKPYRKIVAAPSARIATRTGTARSTQASSRQTGTSQRQSAKQVSIPASYKVKNGDNLWTIARRFDMRVKEILALNPKLTRETVLRLGQVLRLK